MIEGEKVESGFYTLSVQSEMDMIKERLDELEGLMSDSRHSGVKCIKMLE